MRNFNWLKLHVLKLHFANFEFSWLEELGKFIALIFIYYVFIDVLVPPPSKFNFPEVTPFHITIFSGGPPAKTTSLPLLIKNERSPI
jgi:hypothetical protein